MTNLSKQQRWAVLLLIGALAVGSAVLMVRRQESRVKVFMLDEEEKSDKAAPSSAFPVVEKVYVHVCGAVQKPGVYRLPADARVFQAVDAAGGPTSQADTAAVNLAAHINDGEQIYLPRIGEAAVYRRPNPSAKRSSSSSKAAAERSDWPLDLNRATVRQLETVPGIGPSMAARIIAYREQNGGFSSLDELTKVSGIGEKRLEQFREYLCVR